MWIFLNNAYLSIVRHRDLPDQLLVRARYKEHIKAAFPHASVIETPDADYLFRAVVHEAAVADAICGAIMDIDYDNFKNSIPDDRYHTACLNVWTTMYTYQQRGSRNAKKKKN